jgi:hypothetical protein
MQIRRRGLSGEVEISSHDDLFGTFALHTVDQLANLELIRSDAFDRRNGPVQYVVPTPELASPLEREHIQRFLDYTDGPVTIGVEANRARVCFRCVETART